MEGVNRKLPGLNFKVDGEDGYLGEDFAVAVGLLLREVLTAAPAKGHEAVVFPSFLCGLYGLKRSEEQTSELKSLMRILYAVFCLQKKNNKPKLQYFWYPN